MSDNNKTRIRFERFAPCISLAKTICFLSFWRNGWFGTWNSKVTTTFHESLKVGSQLNGLTSLSVVGCVDWELSTSHIAKVPSMTASNVCLDGNGRRQGVVGNGFFGATVPDRPRVFWKWTKRTRWTHRKYKDTHSVITCYNMKPIIANPYLTITSGTLTTTFLWRRIIQIHEKHRFPCGFGARTIARTSVLVPEVRKEMSHQCGTNFGTLLEMKVWKTMIHVQWTIFQVPC